MDAKQLLACDIRNVNNHHRFLSVKRNRN